MIFRPKRRDGWRADFWKTAEIRHRETIYHWRMRARPHLTSPPRATTHKSRSGSGQEKGHNKQLYWRLPAVFASEYRCEVDETRLFGRRRGRRRRRWEDSFEKMLAAHISSGDGRVEWYHGLGCCCFCLLSSPSPSLRVSVTQ